MKETQPQPIFQETEDRMALMSPQNKIKSVNKGGRPKGTTYADLYLLARGRNYITKEVHKNLKDIVGALISKAKKGDIRAAQELLDRAYGKSRDFVSFGGGENMNNLRIVIKKQELSISPKPD